MRTLLLLRVQRMLLFILLPGSLFAATISGSIAAHSQAASPVAIDLSSPASSVSLALLNEAGQSLLARHVDGPGGGWAWQSVIQAPHLQTDRDVGAASVAMGLLALWETTHQQAYLDGAREAGDWLLAIAQPVGGGLRWPDYEDAPNRIASVHYTSFDDGAAGISDLLWRLGVATGDQRYIDGARAGMRWEEFRAEGVGSTPCPQMCRWHWTDTGSTQIYTGMGEGIAGIVYTFDTFAQRTGDSSYEQYALGGAAYLESIMTKDGAIPEMPGTAEWDTGYLSGSAGDAFLFLRLFQRTHNARYLADAQRLLNWVRSEERPQKVGVAWPIMIDPRSGNDNHLATGVEEGNSGIGWVELQAYSITHAPLDLQTALQAGKWLLYISLHEDGGRAWEEDAGRPLVHTSLDNGAPGIGDFLHDLWLANGDNQYQAAANAAVTWLRAVARYDKVGVYWFENRHGFGSQADWDLPREPSWHWGTAGIASFLARMNGWKTDMPGEEPGL